MKRTSHHKDSRPPPEGGARSKTLAGFAGDSEMLPAAGGALREIRKDFRLPEVTLREIRKGFRLPEVTLREIRKDFRLPEVTLREIQKDFRLPEAK